MQIVIASVLVFLIIFIFPIIVYGLCSKIMDIPEPEKKIAFLLSVIVQKIGTTIGFVGIFLLGEEQLEPNWLLYSMIWVAMVAVTEIGQALLPNYSKKEAVAGVISELLYFPLAGFVVMRML